MKRDNFFNGEAERWPKNFDPKFFEQPISQENRENINIVSAEANAILEEYGYEPQSVGADDVLMLSPEGFESMNGGGRLGAFNAESGKIFINAKVADSKLRLALTVAHELFHRGTYPFGQEDRAKTIESLSWLNEAIASLFQKKVFLRLREIDFYRDEIDETQNIEEKYAGFVENEMSKSGYAKDEVFLVRKHSLPGAGGSFTLELRHFPYLKECRAFQTLLKKIAERGETKQGVESLFMKTVPSGDIGPLEKKLGDVLGKSFFEKLMAASDARERDRIIEAL